MIVFKAIRLLLLLGYGVWVRLLGESRARRFLLAGVVCSTIAALILEVTT